MTQSFVYDPGSPGFQETIYDAYRRLRDEHPVYHNEKRGAWVLSRYDDVRAAASDDETFSSENTSIGTGLLPMLVYLDPPRHDQLRNLLAKAFTPRRVADLEPAVRRIASELVDDVVRAGEGDMLRGLASPLPSRVIGSLIGIPLERRETFVEWTEALVSADPHKQNVGDVFPLIYGEFQKLLSERRAEPADDLMSALISAEIDGQGLSEEELLGFCALLVIAGNDTTTNLIANGIVLLARHPEQCRALAENPELLPGAIEEMLRFESPVQALPRIATRDVEMHGERIPAGEEVSLVWGAANRDERRFADADRFDIRREDNNHLALGHGRHFCMGGNLARLEARVTFEELLARMPEYELQAEPQWQVSPWARAFQSVRVRLSG